MSDYGHIFLWPSLSHAELAAIYSALSHVLFEASVTFYVNSSMVITELDSCVSSLTYTDSWLYYHHSNFELWSAVTFLISF